MDFKQLAWTISIIVTIIILAVGIAIWQTGRETTYQIRIFSDPETGCEYLVLENRAIMARIYNGTGGVICRDLKQRDTL